MMVTAENEEETKLIKEGEKGQEGIPACNKTRGPGNPCKNRFNAKHTKKASFASRGSPKLRPSTREDALGPRMT